MGRSYARNLARIETACFWRYQATQKALIPKVECFLIYELLFVASCASYLVYLPYLRYLCIHPLLLERIDMPLPYRDHNIQAERAFDFFQSVYRAQCDFSRSTLQKSTMYSNKTTGRYLRHKWKWFLTRQADGMYCVLPIFAYVTKPEFLAGHSQTWNGENIFLKKRLLEQGNVPRIRITPKQLLLILGIVFLVRVRGYF